MKQLPPTPTSTPVSAFQRPTWRVLLAGLLLIPPLLMAQPEKAKPEPAKEEAEAEPTEDRFLSRTRQLTFDGKRAGEGYYSPDGRYLVFQSEREADNPFFQIYLLDFETGDTSRVSPGTGKTTCSFIRPGSEQILFGSTHHDPQAVAKQKAEFAIRNSGKARRYSWDYDRTMDIFAANRDGSKLVQLTEAEGYDAEGAYSPDGSKIVFCSLRSAYPTNKLSRAEQRKHAVDPAYFGEIYIMNADGSDETRLTNWPGYDGGPFFSPDGERIIWRHFDEKGLIADVYTMKLDGSDRRRLTSFASMSWAPYFHPSGEYVVFASNKLGFTNFEVYLVDALGEKEPIRVTTTDGFDGLPVFSPDGKNLCWTSARNSDKSKGEGSQLFLAQWDHEAALEALAGAAPRSASAAPLNPATFGHGGAKHHQHDGHTLSAEITELDLEHHLHILASDAMEGRLTGTPGERRASIYLASQLKSLGYEPAPGTKGYFQTFPFTAGVKAVKGANKCTVTEIKTPSKYDPSVKVTSTNLSEFAEADVQPLSFSTSTTLSAPVVFAGYGIATPDRSYDSFGEVDLSNKVALVIQGVPRELPAAEREALRPYASLHYKALSARERGAIGFLVVSDLTTGEAHAPTRDHGSGDAGMPAAFVSAKAAAALLGGHDPAALQRSLDTGTKNAFPLGSTIKLSTAVQTERAAGRNVIAHLPGTSGKSLLIGAHYDHIGHGEVDSLARAGEEGEVHNGADDNASGCAVLLELAAALKDQVGEHGLTIAFWSGEELGLIGSSYYANNHPDLQQHSAYLNFDMVGRLRDNRLMLQGTGSATQWKRLIEKRNVVAGFDLALQDDPYLPTDTTAFYPRGLPVLSFFTGAHSDYNRPSDDAAAINYEGLERITKFAQRMCADLLSGRSVPEYVKVENIRNPAGRRTARRAYLGTIPDYTGGEENKGLLLSGVKAGAPADKAGLKEGDTITEFAGRPIKNIYDFAYALDAIKIGDELKVVVQRAGKAVELTVVPEARK